jgi:hypothetical protein
MGLVHTGMQMGDKKLCGGSWAINAQNNPLRGSPQSFRQDLRANPCQNIQVYVL